MVSWPQDKWASSDGTVRIKESQCTWSLQKTVISAKAPVNLEEGPSKVLRGKDLSQMALSPFLEPSSALRRRWWHPTPVLLPGESHGQRSLWAAVHGVTKSWTRLSDFTFTFHVHALEREMATHSSVLAWRISGTGEPGGLPSMGSHRVGHNWSDLGAAAAASAAALPWHMKPVEWKLEYTIQWNKKPSSEPKLPTLLILSVSGSSSGISQLKLLLMVMDVINLSEYIIIMSEYC